MEKSPIRVLHIIQGKHFGGAEQVVLTLVKSFDRDVAASVLCLSQGLLCEKLSEANVPHFLIPMRSRKDVLIPLLKTIMLVRRKHIDIIHTHTVRSNLIGRPAAFFTGRKCITHLHSPIRRDFADFRRGRRNELIDSFTRPITNRHIAVSHSLREEMIRGGVPSFKIVTIHNALDLESLRASQTGNLEKESIKKEYDIPQDAFVLVLVALLRPRKGVEVIIKAMKSVLKHIPNVYLLIVGSDDISESPGYGNGLRKLSRELGIESHVFFTGFQKDVPVILKQCDLMVLPSLFGEGFPMVIPEAMATGVPVIASRIEGIPEIIEDGVNGFLVDPGDSEQLSNKIVKVLKNPILLENVRKEGFKKAMNEMDGLTQAQSVEQVYKEVLAN